MKKGVRVRANVVYRERERCPEKKISSTIGNNAIVRFRAYCIRPREQYEPELRVSAVLIDDGVDWHSGRLSSPRDANGLACCLEVNKTELKQSKESGIHQATVGIYDAI